MRKSTTIEVEAVKDFDCPTHYLRKGKKGHVDEHVATAGIEKGLLKRVGEKKATRKKATPEVEKAEAAPAVEPPAEDNVSPSK